VYPIQNTQTTTECIATCTAISHIYVLLLLKSVEFDDDVALLLSVAGLVMGPHVSSESEIGGTDSAALRTSRTCLRLCGSCVTSCTSFFICVMQP